MKEMERSSKILIVVIVLLALPLAMGLYRRYVPSVRNPLRPTQEFAERESIKGYVRDQFFEHVRLYDDITTTEFRAELGKGMADVSVDMTLDESSEVRLYTVSATLTHKGKERGTANGTASVEPYQSGSPLLHYEIRFDYTD